MFISGEIYHKSVFGTQENVMTSWTSSKITIATQQTNICSKSIIEALEKGVKYVPS